jgi:hypothetical protein
MNGPSKHRISALLLVSVAFGLQVTMAAPLSGRGLLEVATGTSTCLEGTHVLIDPCTGFERYLLDQQFSAVAFDPYLCQYVQASGSDVGIECPIIGADSIALVEPPTCIANLSIFDPSSTWLQWPIRPCALSYDVIRGILPGPTGAAGAVNLGPVVCLVDDLVPPGSMPSTQFGPHDDEAPPPGRAFFYLVRATLSASGVTPYGFSSGGEIESPSSGDCAL